MKISQFAAVVLTAAAISALTSTPSSAQYVSAPNAHAADRGMEPNATAPPTGPIWAVVSFDGKLVRGSNVASATVDTTVSNGASYIVNFKGNVAKCSYVVSLGTTGDNGTVDAGVATVASSAKSKYGVYVSTYDLTGAHMASSFHLQVLC